MHRFFKTIYAITMTGLLIFTSAAWSAGNHAGGHAHGNENSEIGQEGKASQVSRTIQIDMSDTMRFSPSSLTVKAGETIKFEINNTGKIKHEFVLGTDRELKEHYQQMLKFPEMEHDDPNMVTVDPGQSKTLIWKFTNAGMVDFACLLPGHYDAGMKGAVRVELKK